MTEGEKQLNAVIAAVNKKYGEGSLVDLSNKNHRVPVETISTGLPSLDLILGGGIPKGRIIEVYGEESSGKSTMALHILKQAQKECPDRKVAYIDAENAFDPDYAEKLGIDVSKMFLNQPDSGEEALDIIEKLCDTGKISVIVVDSVANLVPNADNAKEIDASANIGTRASMLSRSLPRLANAANATKTVIFFINQIRMKIGVMYGNPETTPGGMALKFNASIRMQVRAGKAEERDGMPGVPVHCRIKKNKIAPPGRTTQLFLVFGQGFDAEADMIETAVGAGIIEKSGAWFSYGGLKEQGLKRLVEKIKADEKLLTQLQTDLRNTKASDIKPRDEDEV